MLVRFLGHLRQQWMGALALLLVLTGGVAYAANTIGSTDIVNGQVKSVDVGTGQVQSIDVKDEGLSGADVGGLGGGDIADESLTGADMADEAVTADKIDFLARSPRAYWLSTNACQAPVDQCSTFGSKRMQYAVRVRNGSWCLRVDGIDADSPGAVAVVIPADPSGGRWAQWFGQGPNGTRRDCVDAEFEIHTGQGQTESEQNFVFVVL